MIRIPEKDKRFSHVGKSDVLGNIWDSFNLDLSSNAGRIRVSPRLIANTTTLTDVTGACPAFKRFASDGSTYKFWTCAGNNGNGKVLCSGSDLATDFSDNAISGAPTTCDVAYSDIDLFNNELYVSTKSNSLYYLNTSGAWASVTVGGSNIGPHPMTGYGTLLYYVWGGNVIHSINSSHSVSAALLTLGGVAGDQSNIITCMRAASNRIWLFTLNAKGGKGNIYEWDGASTQVTRSYRLEATGVLAAVIKDDIPWVLDTEGRLLVWTGGTFKEVDRLPTKNKYLVNANSITNNRFIHPNGMTVLDGKINLLINNLNGDQAQSINENLPSGIWEYDENIGLYHKQSVTYYNDTNGTVTDFGQNRVSAVGALSSMKYYSTAATANGSLIAGVTYFTDASSTESNIFFNDTNDTVQKFGYLVTPWIESQNVKDVWQKLSLKYKKFLDSGDKIVAKYHTSEATPVNISITWDNSTTVFKTTTDVSTYVGYEVEVLQGTGSGKCAHITGVTYSAPNYYVTVDEVFTGVTTGTAKARLQNWKKITSVSNQTTESNVSALGDTSERIQLKVCMLFTGADELHEIGIINKTNEPLT